MTNKEAIEELKKVDTLDMPARLCEAHYMAIKALEQETKTNVLDKIRAEIEQYEADCLFADDSKECKECDKVVFGTIYRIIDKYKAESENA